MSAFVGTRIVDFSQGIAGPMATMLFADFEADVIKVEPPAGDRLKDHPGYLAWNRNKRRIRLDLSRWEGRRDAHRLIATSDVAVFDGRPGELEALGLDAVTLCAGHPRLLHVTLPPFGLHGRWSQLPPNDDLIHALSAVAFLQHTYSGVPVQLVTPQVAYAHATIAANAIAAGLLERSRSGQGQAITVSGLHAVASVESGGAIRGTMPVMRLGTGSSRGSAPNYRLYRCADDQWFFLGTLTPQFFLKALEAIDMMDLLTLPGIDGEFANLLNPATNTVVKQALDVRFAEKTRQEWLVILHAADVPCAPVGRREEWFLDEPVASNDMRVVLPHPKHGDVELPGVAAKLNGTPGSVRHHLEDATLEEVLGEVRRGGEAGDSEEAGTSAGSVRTVASGGRPLAGVRVLDMGAFIAGTFAPTVLANFGADVIKIEPADGDPFRLYGLLFVGHNQGKRSLAIDLKSADGRAVLHDLVRGADVVLDNFRLGVRERLGIDYASLSAVNPRIITCSVTGYGPAGALANDPGFDPLLQARSGMMAAQGGDAEPVFHQIAVNDSATAMMAAFAIQAALAARERTGRGQEVHTCLVNQSVLFQSGEVTWFEGRTPSPVGGLDFTGAFALRRNYACAGGWLALSAGEEQFHDVALALGHPDWAGRMTAEHAAKEPADGVLAGLIGETLAAMPRDEAVERLLAKGVPAAPALTVDEFFADPWVRANGFFRDYEHPRMGLITAPRGFAEWSRSEGGFARTAPLIGEHTREVLAEAGLSEERIEALFAAGVISRA